MERMQDCVKEAPLGGALPWEGFPLLLTQSSRLAGIWEGKITSLDLRL